MAQRCEHCRHWVDTVFKGQSASGYGVWYGNCHSPNGPRPEIGRDRHSLMLACSAFEAGTHPNSLNAAMQEKSMTTDQTTNDFTAADMASQAADGFRAGEEASYSAADMASASAQGFRDGYASQAKMVGLASPLKTRDVLRAEIEALREKAAMHDAIQRACAELPLGADLHIELENGAGTVRLYLPDTDADVTDFGSDLTFVQQINAAIDAAIQEKQS